MKSALDMDTRTPFEWEPCPKCSERLEYGTNGMGRLVTICPVCDWGHRPAREYDIFKQRMEAAEPIDMRVWNVCVCGERYPRHNGAQRYCSNRCRQAARRAVQSKTKRRERQCVQCGARIVALNRQRKYCAPCGTMKQKEVKRLWWQSRKLAAWDDDKGAA